MAQHAGGIWRSSTAKGTEPRSVRRSTTEISRDSVALQRAIADPSLASNLSVQVLQRTLGNRAVGRLLQPKLTIGQPNDKYEQEADRVADQVMRSIASPGNEASRPSITPISAEVVPRAARSADGIVTGPVGPSFEHALGQSGSGHPLADSVRTSMERAFGSDFGGVRVHTSAAADEMSRSVNARAFTVGQDIYFSGDAFRPESAEGRRLLAHELTHTVQQREAGSTTALASIRLQRAFREAWEAAEPATRRPAWFGLIPRVPGKNLPVIIRLANEYASRKKPSQLGEIQSALFTLKNLAERVDSYISVHSVKGDHPETVEAFTKFKNTIGAEISGLESRLAPVAETDDIRVDPLWAHSVGDGKPAARIPAVEPSVETTIHDGKPVPAGEDDDDWSTEPSLSDSRPTTSGLEGKPAVEENNKRTGTKYDAVNAFTSLNFNVFGPSDEQSTKKVSTLAFKRLSYAENAIQHAKSVFKHGAGNQKEALLKTSFNSNYRTEVIQNDCYWEVSDTVKWFVRENRQAFTAAKAEFTRAGNCNEHADVAFDYLNVVAKGEMILEASKNGLDHAFVLIGDPRRNKNDEKDTVVADPWPNKAYGMLWTDHFAHCKPTDLEVQREQTANGNNMRDVILSGISLTDAGQNRIKKMDTVLETNDKIENDEIWDQDEVFQEGKRTRYEVDL